jgi:hypothetical protein
VSRGEDGEAGEDSSLGEHVDEVEVRESLCVSVWWRFGSFRTMRISVGEKKDWCVFAEEAVQSQSV